MKYDQKELITASLGFSSRLETAKALSQLSRQESEYFLRLKEIKVIQEDPYKEYTKPGHLIKMFQEFQQNVLGILNGISVQTKMLQRQFKSSSSIH